MAMTLLPSFWERIGLKEAEKAACIEAVQSLYPRCVVEEFEHQGYCSFTLVVRPLDWTVRTDTLIVQLRPPQHALSLTITDAATKIYPDLAPTTRQLSCELQGNLLAYEMPKLRGEPMSLLQPQARSPCAEIQEKQATLIKSLSVILAQSWLSASEAQRLMRADSPMSSAPPAMLSHCSGKVGRLIIPKLHLLAQTLPSAALRQRAQDTLDKIQEIDAYPVVLTHGDLIPSNILVDPQTWRITGLIDWAEAEYLPWGTCLYALEHLLGYMSPESRFAYFDAAPRLRALFWECLFDTVPEVRMRLEEVRVMRDLGVLLWHGFAWDEGKIDRVVEEGRDAVELEKLRAFLDVE